jgi:uncharacterized membrane protein (UPF0127 family)
LHSKGQSSPRRSFLLCLVLLAGCGGAEKGAHAVLSGPDGETTVTVEVADSNAERARGLMGRKSLPADAGMVFVYDDDQRGPFWMKNTLIPLSIAFYDADGRILRILDMVPCTRDPCPLYDPGVTYRGALEVNRGAFTRWRVVPGDRLRITSG